MNYELKEHLDSIFCISWMLIVCVLAAYCFSKLDLIIIVGVFEGLKVLFLWLLVFRCAFLVKGFIDGSFKE